MTTYRRKPIEIDAWLIRSLVGVDFAALPEVIQRAILDGVIKHDGDGFQIATMKGVMKGGLDWYLIRGIEGEFYPCEADNFAKSYEKVDQE